jgi:hypothetical protein
VGAADGDGVKGGLQAQRSFIRPPPPREFAADPAKAAQSAADKQQAVAAAEALLAAKAGVNYRDTYVRATLVSYGASCRVFTAVDKHTQQPVAIKTITKVCELACVILRCACVSGGMRVCVHAEARPHMHA